MCAASALVGVLVMPVHCTKDNRFKMSAAYKFLLFCVLTFSPVWCARRNSSQRSHEVCIDMTRKMQPMMNHFPKLQEFLLNVTTKDIVDVKFQMEVMTSATHMGTHMDAPRHFNENGITVDEIPVQNFNNIPAYVVDVRNKTNQDPGYEIDAQDLEDWQKEQKINIANGSLVFLLTGWGKRWSDRASFLGTDKDEPELLKFPGLSPLGATWLAQRAIVGVGTECVSIDPNGEAKKTAHRTILNSPHGMYILENLANMDLLPTKGSKVNAYPMKIGDASGAPARVVACFRERSNSGSRPPSRDNKPSRRRRPNSRDNKPSRRQEN